MKATDKVGGSLLHNYKEGARTMKDNSKEKQVYEKPRVIVTYKKEELEAIIKPHGQGECTGGLCGNGTSGGGCGCGCGG